MTESFVPVTVDQKLLHRDMSGNKAEMDAIRKLSAGKSGYLGVYAAAADGTSLGVVYTTPNDMLKMLNEALAKFGPVTPRNVKALMINPDRGYGVKSDGSVRLSLSVRYMDDGKPQHMPVFASLYLNSAEWATLVPKEGKPGERWQVPDTVAKRFSEAIPGLSNLEYLIRPEDVTEAQLAAEVLPARSSGDIQVRIVGHVAGKRDYLKDPKQPMWGHTKYEGILTLDAKRTPLRLFMLFEGRHQAPWGKERPVGAVIDWRAEGQSP